MIVWRQEVGGDDGVRHVREVRVYLDDQMNISVAGYSIGKRGGYSNGIPGFTAVEWMQITSTVQRLIEGFTAKQYTVFGVEANGIIRCEPCQEAIYARHIIEHERHREHQLNIAKLNVAK